MKRYIICLIGIISSILIINTYGRSACGCRMRSKSGYGHTRRIAYGNPGNNAGRKPIVMYLSQSGVFDTVLHGLRVSGLLQTQQDEEDLVARLGEAFANSHRLHEITFFAPRDRAFRDMPDYLYYQLFRNPRKLRDVLLYHIVDGIHMAEDLDNGVMDTLYGEHITLERQRNGDMVIDGHSRIVQSDIKADRGVIHTIDTVLLP